MFLLFLSLALINCIKFPLTQRCACSEYEELICKNSLYCTWDGSSCTDLVCKYQQEGYCTPFFSSYLCKWNEGTQTCEDHKYECSELTKESCFTYLFGMDCMWQDDQCKPQDCTAHDQCNPLKCSYGQKKCGQQMDDLDCSSYTNETCQITDGNGNVCTLNDKQECKEYHVLSSSCSDYEDRIQFCDSLCYYDISSQSCIQKECSQITDESLCKYYLLDIPSLQLVPCMWSNNTCNEVTEKDFETFDSLQCLQYGLLLQYTWQPSTSTCQQCTSLVHNPQYEYYEQLLNGFELEIFKLALLWLTLYI